MTTRELKDSTSLATTALYGVAKLAADGGTTAGTVVQATDARLTNARTPTAHKTSHESGGSDAFTGIVPGSSFAPSGLTGATSASRYVGATTSGAPATGTFVVGDYVIAQDGAIWVCTTAGSPGTWTEIVASAGSALTVEEVDGTPTDAAITKIVFPNGTLSITSHVATYTPASGAGISSNKGALASIPAAGNTGDLYLPTDAPYLYRDNGTTWDAFYRSRLATPPQVGSFTWGNQNGVTASNAHGFLSLTNCTANQLSALLLTAPATPYTVTIEYDVLILATGEILAGLLWRDSAGGAVHMLSVSWSNIGEFEWYDFTSLTVLSSRRSIDALGNNGWRFLRIGDDGTNRYFAVSKDGYNFITVRSLARTTWLTPDQIGIAIYGNSPTRFFTVYDWVVA